MPEMFFVVALIIIALIFDFINGFHDAANAIATVVATRVLSPVGAIAIAAFFNFAGAFVFSVAVATTIGKGIIIPSAVTLHLILAALIGGIIWNLITWRWGLPSSSSHALIGGLIGAAAVSAGLGAIQFSGIYTILLFIVFAPLLGMAGAIVFSGYIMRFFRKSDPGKVNIYFRRLQLISSSMYSLGHGTNDAQKTMGIIAIILLAGGVTTQFEVPLWVILSCHAAIALGTLAGGWRIVKTMGTKITKLRPVDGFSAETSSSVVLFSTASTGIPVSTTHVISGSIMGVGAVKGAGKVRWPLARKIMWAWILTIPITAIIAGVSYLGIMMFV